MAVERERVQKNKDRSKGDGDPVENDQRKREFSERQREKERQNTHGVCMAHDNGAQSNHAMCVLPSNHALDVRPTPKHAQLWSSNEIQRNTTSVLELDRMKLTWGSTNVSVNRFKADRATSRSMGKAKICKLQMRLARNLLKSMKNS